MRGGRSVAAALAAVACLVAASGANGSPAVDYTVHCRGCHRADGAATPGRIPALASSVGRFVGVPGGRAFLVRVPGAAQAPLSDGELAALLNWILREFSAAELPPGFEPYTAGEVGRHRGEPLVEVERVRAALLRALERAATSGEDRP